MEGKKGGEGKQGIDGKIKKREEGKEGVDSSKRRGRIRKREENKEIRVKRRRKGEGGRGKGSQGIDEGNKKRRHQSLIPGFPSLVWAWHSD